MRRHLRCSTRSNKQDNRDTTPMRRFPEIIFLLLLILLARNVLPAQETALPPGHDSTQTRRDSTVAGGDSAGVGRPDTLRKMANKAFAAGEYLKFEIHYGFVTAGEAIMKISDTTLLLPSGNRRCLKIDFAVNSKPFFDLVYKVRDRYRTILDAEGLFPWRFEQHIREGGYSRDFTAEFDQIQHVARTSEGDHPIPSYVHDIMSAFYFARTLDYSASTPGQKFHLQNFYKDSTYELDVKFKGRQETEVDAGTFKCIVIEPLAREGGLFKSEGKVYVWLTDDDRKMPVKVSSKIAIGSVDSDLIEFHGLNGPVSARKTEE
jgi:hypothetical protein